MTREQYSRFWILQLAAWGGYGVVSFAGALPYVGAVPHLDSVRSLLANRLAFVALGLLATGLLRIAYRRQRRQPASVARLALLACFASHVSGLIATAAANLARHAAGGMDMSGWAVFGGAVGASAIFLAWSACYFAACAHNDMEQEKRNALRAAAQAREAQFAVLRGQVNPHFLFNALNSIQALIRESPARAEFAVEKLASLLRHSLRQNGSCETSLAEELDVIGQYLAIEKIRFEEKLQIDTHVEPEAERFLVPGLLFHPLVENAIKHGMQTSDMPLQLRIRAALAGDSLRFEIANSGKWRERDARYVSERGVGIGLRLVRERLEQAYPGCHRFERSCANGWVTQRIELEDAGRMHAAARIAGG